MVRCPCARTIVCTDKFRYLDGSKQLDRIFDATKTSHAQILTQDRVSMLNIRDYFLLVDEIRHPHQR